MNPELLADAHPHVREEHEKLNAAYGAVARALDLAVQDLRAGKKPPGDDFLATLEAYLRRGWLVHHEELAA